ncbi:conjugal transfer protein [Salmonella enterica]|nr:conjugal transfer protein [Salmonella enterica]
MILRKLALIVGLVMFAHGVQAAAIPKGSQYDKRNQSVIYNPANVTVVNVAMGYLTTLVFDEDENVLEKPQVGFPAGWDVQESGNVVYVRIQPVTQNVEQVNSEGEIEEKEIAFDPEEDLERFRTNLFIKTTKRNYLLELKATSFTKPEQVSFVVNYRYPNEERKQQAELEKKRLEEYQRQQEQTKINRALENAKMPRNWKYYSRVAEGSEYIKPDYAYDDGRFTYFGFNPTQKIPSVFVQFGEKEMIVDPVIEKKGNYTVIVISQLSDKWVLRLGSQVVGVENKGFGKIRLPDSDTVSSDVKKEVIQ